MHQREQWAASCKRKTALEVTRTFTVVMLVACWMLISVSTALADENYHTNPLCWESGRIFHPKSSDEMEYATRRMSESVTVEHVKSHDLKNPSYSSNKAYAVSSQAVWTKYTVDGHDRNRQDFEIFIYNERPYLIHLNVQNIYIGEINWVNEKVLFVRIWWGRLVGVDVFYDVELEKIIEQQPFMAGWQAFNQYKNQCSHPEWKDKDGCRPKCYDAKE